MKIMYDENGWIWPKLFGVVKDAEGNLHPCTKDEHEEINRLEKLWEDRMFEIREPLGYSNMFKDRMKDEEIKKIEERLNELYQKIYKRPCVKEIKEE